MSESINYKEPISLFEEAKIYVESHCIYNSETKVIKDCDATVHNVSQMLTRFYKEIRAKEAKGYFVCN